MTPWRLLPTEEQWNKMKDVCGASCAFVVCHRLQDDNLIGKAGFLPENWPALGWLGWLQLICTWLMWRYLTTNHYNTMMSLHTHSVFFYLFSHFLPTLLSYMLTAKVTSREWTFWNLSFIIFSFIFRPLLLWKLYQLKKEFLPVTEVIWPICCLKVPDYVCSLFSDGAPGGQAVSDRFSLSWDSVLVSSDNIIVARLDGRGGGFQGQRILHEVHQRLGTVDVQDQIAAVEYVITSILFYFLLFNLVLWDKKFKICANPLNKSFVTQFGI